ncbi:MAG: AI-2E family transporter, partial [Bifidobacteriales bacterium]|nr:AI-2E family transporter [Bifidobacteriales bacterium]
KISERTMDLNPAVAFLSVLAFGAVFGALGAFLALPLAASFQAIFNASIKHYELIDSPLMQDPKPVGKSKVVESVEAFNEHVVQPVTNHVGARSAKGSSARVSVQDPVSRIAEQLYRPPTAEDLDESRTVAIPKSGKAKAKGKSPLKGAEGGEAGQGNPESGSPAQSSQEANPRKEWR